MIFWLYPGVPINQNMSWCAETCVTSVNWIIVWQLDNLINNKCFDNKIGSLLDYLGYFSRLDLLDHSGQLGHLGQLGHMGQLGYQLKYR